MKKLFISGSFLALMNVANAQWGGPGISNTTGDIYRNGHVGIGTGSPGSEIEIQTLGTTDGGITITTPNWGTSGGSFLYLANQIFGNGYNIGSLSNGHFNLLNWTNNGNGFSSRNILDVDGSTGYIGVGTNLPNKQLHVLGTGDAILRLEGTTNNGRSWDIVSSGGQGLLYSGDFGIVDVTNNLVRFTIDKDGHAHIGNPFNIGAIHIDALLTVKGKIAAQEVVVTQQNWSDFVFDKNYKLMPLVELEKFYQLNKHLPDVPTAIEISETGNALGQTDAVLLRKIEELTMYIVKLEKEIDTVKEKTGLK